jgi:hypothetical protein
MPKSTFMRTAAAAGFAASVLLQVTTANSQEADSGSTEPKGGGRYELNGTSQPSRLSDRQQLERYFLEGVARSIPVRP